jgi:hypothetical protein
MTMVRVRVRDEKNTEEKRSEEKTREKNISEAKSKEEKTRTPYPMPDHKTRTQHELAFGLWPLVSPVYPTLPWLIQIFITSMSRKSLLVCINHNVHVCMHLILF